MKVVASIRLTSPRQPKSRRWLSRTAVRIEATIWVSFSIAYFIISLHLTLLLLPLLHNLGKRIEAIACKFIDSKSEKNPNESDSTALLLLDEV